MEEIDKIITDFEKFLKDPSSIDKISIPSVGLSQIDAALKKLGFERSEFDGGETNGWQVDFWYYYRSEEHGEICLSGSLWYGDWKIVKVE